MLALGIFFFFLSNTSVLFLLIDLFFERSNSLLAFFPSLLPPPLHLQFLHPCIFTSLKLLRNRSSKAIGVGGKKKNILQMQRAL